MVASASELWVNERMPWARKPYSLGAEETKSSVVLLRRKGDALLAQELSR
jgi:hypothetical protein